MVLKSGLLPWFTLELPQNIRGILFNEGSQVRCAKLVVTIAAVVVFAQINCVAACAADLCRPDCSTEPTPPCHKHHDHSHNQSPDSCSLRGIVSPATSPHAPQLDAPVLSVLGFAATVPADLPADGRSFATELSDSSPPGLTNLLSTIVLRV